MIKHTQMRVKTGTIKHETLLQTNDMDIVEKFGKNEVLNIVQSEINTVHHNLIFIIQQNMDSQKHQIPLHSVSTR